MTYWLTITLIVCLAVCVPLIGADVERLNGADSQKKLIDNSQTNEEKTSSISDVNRFSKRASFMPSRGKKEEYEQFTGLNDVGAGDADKKASAGFLPMRGRKDYSNDQPAQGWHVNSNDYNYGFDDKRAGFMPMRGRKNNPYDESELTAPVDDVYTSELDAIKRMSSFMPMRGRKDDYNYDQTYGQSYGQNVYAMAQPYSPSIQSIGRPNWMEGQHSSNGGPELEKKANAFFGSRGKRSVRNYVNRLASMSADGEHRYNENFFATRG